MRPLGLALLLAVGSASAQEVPTSLPGGEPFPSELRAELEAALAARGADYEPRTKNLHEDGTPRYTNRLLLEGSPYLRQHAHNPVDWRPWGEEAFAAARRRGQPLFVSIGYSTCHWCHVMEEQSFDDPEIARLLNEHFVAVKVDREARPDVDAVYMAALHRLRGGGGWPLNMWVTPAGEPFFGGTYFPPEDRPGRPGFPSVLRSVERRWREARDGVDAAAATLTRAVRAELAQPPALATRVPDPSMLRSAMAVYARSADRTWGGRGRGTKFPSSLPVRFLLRYHRRTGSEDALGLANLALERMAAGGIRDHLGGGFHRYATDRRWVVPHFEKMLYDQALQVLAYVEGWQATGRADFARVAREALDFVAREMTAPGGGFHSALDADSAGPDGEVEEGRFYTWTPAELAAALGAEKAAIVGAWYGVSPAGQLEGRSVLHTFESPAEVAARLGIAADDLSRRVEAARPKLLRVRERRPRPLRDEKVIAAWNGLMISAFARAGLAFDEPRYVAAAARAAHFVLGEMRSEGRLARVHQDGRPEGEGFLEDHAFVIAGLLDLHEADPDPAWLAATRSLQERLDADFADPEGGGYFRTGAHHERLLAREKPGHDGAIPSGSSVSALSLLRLYELSLDGAYLERAGSLFSVLHPVLAETPSQASELLLAVDYYLDASKEVALVAPAGGAGLDALLRPLRRAFVPNRVLVVTREGAPLEAHAAQVPWLRDKRALGGRATAYVCESQVCELPTSDPALFATQLREAVPLP